MELKDAYKMVYLDMLSKNTTPSVFFGTYDAKNGSEKYMHGIATVMEYIVDNTKDENIIMEFDEIFCNNMLQSKGVLIEE